MIAYPGETVKLYCSIRAADGTAPASISDVEFAIMQDDREITAFTAMTAASGTRYYASWAIPTTDTGRYFVVVTATVDGGAWEQVIDDIDVRRDTEKMIETMYIKSLKEGEYRGLRR